MSDFMRTLADSDGDMELAVNREALRFAIGRAIFCEVTGRVLDVRDSVYVRVADSDDRAYGASVLLGSVWDEAKERVMAPALAAGYTVEVLDGRELFA